MNRAISVDADCLSVMTFIVPMVCKCLSDYPCPQEAGMLPKHVKGNISPGHFTST